MLIQLFFASSLAKAALLPPASECRDRRPLETVTQITSLEPEQVIWDCLDFSKLNKTDLLQVAAKAPSIYVRISNSTLTRADLIEVHNTSSKLTVEVDSSKFNRVDIVEMRKEGVRAVVSSSGTGLNVNDYREIAKGEGDPVTVELNGPNLTLSELMTVIKEPGLRFIVDPAKANFSETDVENILKAAPETRIRL